MEYTSEEIQEEFVKSVLNIVDYWSNDPRVESKEDVAFGVAHSILVLLDGCGSLPGFEVALVPCEEENKGDYDKFVKAIEDMTTVHGDSMLHDLLGAAFREREKLSK